jgi:hypothetical protein
MPAPPVLQHALSVLAAIFRQNDAESDLKRCDFCRHLRHARAWRRCESKPGHARATCAACALRCDSAPLAQCPQRPLGCWSWLRRTPIADKSAPNHHVFRSDCAFCTLEESPNGQTSLHSLESFFRGMQPAQPPSDGLSRDARLVVGHRASRRRSPSSSRASGA